MNDKFYNKRLDHKTYFKNEIVDRLLKQFEIRHLLFTLYHPQINRLVERFNRTLCKLLAKITEDKENWNQYLVPVLFIYKIAKQASRK